MIFMVLVRPSTCSPTNQIPGPPEATHARVNLTIIVVGA